MFWAPTALADPFEGSELLVGRNVKQPKGAKKFAIGLNFQFAPVNMILGKLGDAAVDLVAEQVCAGQGDECRQGLDTAVSVMNTMTDEQWDDVKKVLSGETSGETLEGLKNKGVIDQGQYDAAATYNDKLEQLPADDVGKALDLTRAALTTKGTTYLFEPNLEINLKVLSLNLKLPLGMVSSDEDKRWYFGNIALDAKIGHAWGKDMAAFGLAGGLSIYAPTASKSASRMTAADLWFGPKFMHGYLTLAPFVSLGFHNKWISIQGHAELISQHQVYGDAGESWVAYMKYGGGLVLVPTWPISIIGEINGLTPFKNADAYNALFALAGLQLRIKFIKAALALQMPIVHGGESSLSGITGGEMSELARISLICRAAFIF